MFETVRCKHKLLSFLTSDGSRLTQLVIVNILAGDPSLETKDCSVNISLFNLTVLLHNQQQLVKRR